MQTLNIAKFATTNIDIIYVYVAEICFANNIYVHRYSYRLIKNRNNNLIAEYKSNV
jgi:hypothetical protein